MNVNILSVLCCPICKGNLSAEPFFEEKVVCSQDNFRPNESKQLKKASANSLVKEGILLCNNCMTWYPIASYVPVMLTFETVFHRRFATQHANRIRAFEGYRIPSRQPEIGERGIQETFTDEWDNVHDNTLSFLYSEEDLKALNRKVWLKWLEDSRHIKTVLNVGCGLGMETLALQEVVDGAEVFGVDLNFALLRSGATYKANTGIHFIIASLFHLPFHESLFDLVYSQGVIHHTFSTRIAFNSIASYVREGGHLFIWIYGLDDHLIRRGSIGVLSRALYVNECIVRPVVSRLPKIVRDVLFNSITVIIHPLVKMRVRHKYNWTFQNTNHGLRDGWSHRYAHRHSYNEVFEWFEYLNFRIVDVQSPAMYRELFQKQLWGVGVTGEKRKAADCSLGENYPNTGILEMQS